MTADELIPPQEAARLLKTTYGSLAVWRCHRNKALPFVRLGRKIFYRMQDIQKFIESQVDPGIGPRPQPAAIVKPLRRRRR